MAVCRCHDRQSMPPLRSRGGVESGGSGLALVMLTLSACAATPDRLQRRRHPHPPTSGSHPTRASPQQSFPMRTGVPGLAATDPFCAAWAAYAGTLQALGVAGSFGGLTVDQLAVLELRAVCDLSRPPRQSLQHGRRSWRRSASSSSSTASVPTRRRSSARRCVGRCRATPADLADAELGVATGTVDPRPRRDAVIDRARCRTDLAADARRGRRRLRRGGHPFASDPSLVVDYGRHPADRRIPAHRTAPTLRRAVSATRL